MNLLLIAAGLYNLYRAFQDGGPLAGPVGVLGGVLLWTGISHLNQNYKENYNRDDVKE